MQKSILKQRSTFENCSLVLRSSVHLETQNKAEVVLLFSQSINIQTAMVALFWAMNKDTPPPKKPTFAELTSQQGEKDQKQ